MTQYFFAFCALLSAFSVFISSAGAAALVTTNASWRLFKGRTEASSPDLGAWRVNGFNDAAFADAVAPFTYGEGFTYGTDMSDMLNSYSCFFLRKSFVLTNVAEIAALRIGAKVDDGFVLWINGSELLRVNVAGVAGEPVTINTLAGGATEPVPFVFYDVTSPAFLLNGTNVLTVQVFNTTLNSSDIVFDASLDSIQVETNPPVIVSVTPARGSTLASLTQITVEFSEPLSGLSADDLNVRGIGATGLSVSGNTYTFTFPPAPYGAVPITWVSGHGIVDQAFPPNPFDETRPGASWSYTLVDNVPPVVAALFPPAGAALKTLGQIQVTFSEAVAGLNASDLLINGQPATNLIALPNFVYVFQFAQPGAGAVSVAWAAGHGITDVATSPNAFAGGSWNYTLDPNANLTGLMITEINAANQNGLRDEDGEEQDWIEIFNSSTNAINLGGWSLSEDADEPGRWIFPSRVLGAGQFLVVFASGKDRENPTGTNRFHTNFKLSVDGEFIGLFTPDSPRVLASSFGTKFPVQRNDFSYGRDPNGQLRYFATPTPGASNGPSTIVGVTEKVHFSAARGHYSQPFNLVLSSATRGATIRYTTNGTEPTLVNGLTYLTPLPINNTFLIRAAAFRTNLLSSAVESHSYFFNVSAAIRSLPIISIQTAANNLTGTNGIIGMSGGSGPPANPWVASGPNDYYNPTKTGIAWERPMSVEFINPLDNSGFQIDSGMRVQGSDYTRPRYEPNSKFSYRLYFRGDYGSSRLRYPLFSDSVVQEFDQIVMRAGHNDISNPFLRDELVRQLSADMGQAACHGTWVNFFINGVYKGYYNPTERVEEGFLQSWHGGSNSWDILTVGSAVQGGDNVEWNSMRSYASGQNPALPNVYTELTRRVDVVNFIDYLLVNVYGASWDWPHNNWRAARERAPGGIFRFYIWDAEGAFGLTGRAASNFDSFSTTDSGLLTSSAEIPTLYQRLRLSSEFRLLWADRVQKHFFNNGAMTDSNILSRFLQMRSELLGVIPNIDNSIMTTWIPQRRAPLFAQFNLYGLFASSNAPSFSQHGGTVPPGFNLTMTANGGGTIYYTTNGADPRVMFSGAVSNAALAYAGPIALNQSTLVKARSLVNGTNWSAVTEANFAVATIGPSLRITEINYNPSGSTAYEFIELQNISTAPVDLSGMNFEGVTFAFPNFSTLAGGARLVLASDFDPAAFALRYPGVTVRGYYSGSLNNGGERIALKDAAGNVITSLDYDDAGGWPTAADGGGFTFEIVNPFGDPDDPANWRASTTLGGTPGAASTLPALGAVRLNEVLAENLGAANNGGTFPDFVELANTSGAPVDLSGWSLTDDGTVQKFVFPPGTTIAANGYLTVWCDAVTNTTPGLHSGFSFGRSGDNVYLYNAGANLMDALTFGLQLPNYSVGRSGNDWVLTTPTVNAANIGAGFGSASSLVINEFLANALPGNPDWIELFNNSAQPVPLRGVFLSNTAAVHQVTSLSFIAPYGFVQFFADEGTGPDHLDFKLPAAGGAIVLYNNVATEVNRVTYGAQSEGVSRGRLPDGNANIVNFPGTSSPGATNYIASYAGPVWNEVLARNAAAFTNAAGRVADYVELYNASASPFSLAGFSLSVNALEPGQWRFPPDATIAGQSYLVIWCDDGRPVSTNGPIYNVGQALDGNSGGAYLFNPAGQLVNSVEYGFQVADRSIGLSGGSWRLLTAPTPGAANAAAATLGVATTLRLNEWMAQPDSGPDWFEIFNASSLPVDLTGLLLTDDPSSAGTNALRLAPLSFIGASNFVQCLADSQPDQGRNHVSFELDSLGETIRMYGANGAVIDTVAFGVQGFATSQGRLPDGGSSILSFPGSATPAEANYRLLTEVAINELLTHANAPLEDTVELRNLNGTSTDLSGWFLSDDSQLPRKFRIANGTTISSNGFLLFSESQFNTGVNAFTLDRARGGELWLSSVDANDSLTGYRTGVKFGAAAEGVSFGAYSASGGPAFVAQVSRTLPGANAGPLIGPVVINELMYHPPDGVSGATEFVELRNISSAAVNLFDPARPTNTWRLGDGISFAFPPSTTLAANGYLLVVDFDPVADPLALSLFRSHYGVAGSVPVFGPFLGKLDNGGETIELFKPDLPDGAYIPYVRVDKVSYRDASPWPEGSVDGGGLSLQRRTGNAYGNDAANWVAALPTAGSVNASGGIAPPVFVKSPASTNVLINSDLLLQAEATGFGSLSWQWRFNGAKLDGQTNSSLFINYLQPTDAGAYDVYVSNPGGPVFSAVAQIGVAEPPVILSAPPGLYITNAGSNALFSILVSGTAPLSYQWRLDGTPIPGATTPVLSFTNLALAQSGPYELTVTNAYGVAVTNISLVVSIKPVVTNHLQPQTVLQGETAVFQVVAGPDHPFARLGYRWLRNGAAFLTNQSPILILTNVQVSATYRVSITNQGNTAGTFSPAAGSVQLTVLADLDRDGLADYWESNYFGITSTNDPLNAVQDPDGDGMSNRDEYIAGTNPMDAASVLKILTSTGNPTTLEFIAQSNVGYSVQWATNLASPWLNLTNVASQTGVRTIRVDSAVGPPLREKYFRVVTPLVP